MKRIRHWVGMLVLVVALSMLGGCNTAEGFGEDMEEAGEAIQEEAEE